MSRDEEWPSRMRQPDLEGSLFQMNDSVFGPGGSNVDARSRLPTMETTRHLKELQFEDLNQELNRLTMARDDYQEENEILGANLKLDINAIFEERDDVRRSLQREKDQLQEYRENNPRNSSDNAEVIRREQDKIHDLMTRRLTFEAERDTYQVNIEQLRSINEKQINNIEVGAKIANEKMSELSLKRESIRLEVATLEAKKLLLTGYCKAKEMEQGKPDGNIRPIIDSDAYGQNIPLGNSTPFHRNVSQSGLTSQDGSISGEQTATVGTKPSAATDQRGTVQGNQYFATGNTSTQPQLNLAGGVFQRQGNSHNRVNYSDGLNNQGQASKVQQQTLRMPNQDVRYNDNNHQSQSGLINAVTTSMSPSITPSVSNQVTRSGINDDQRDPDVPYNRRKSMSQTMQVIMDNNPVIGGLGIDCFHDVTDGTEVMAWTMKQANRLMGSSNAARRVAKVPKPYNGKSPWKEEYQNFLDDMDCSGWDKEQSLPQLIAWLKDGPGKAAVEQWRQVYGATGTYDDLVASAAYLFGSLVAEDPMTAYWKRGQKKDESAKVYGLELKGLLHKARPRWRYDDKEFIEDLFKRFCTGLINPEHQQVAAEAWKPEAALADLFIALDNFDKKKLMFAGLIQPRTSAVAYCSPVQQVQDEQSVDDDSDSDESYQVCYIQNGKFMPKNKFDKNKGYSKPRRTWLSPEDWEKQKLAKRQQPVTSTSGLPAILPKAIGNNQLVEGLPMTNQQLNVLEENLMKKFRLSNVDNRRPWVDPATVVCNRCQLLGHLARECMAVKPIPRYTGNKPPQTSSVRDEPMDKVVEN